MVSRICRGIEAMIKNLQQLRKEILQQRTEEQKLKNEIAKVTTVEFSHWAASVLDPKKHLYGFEGYLSLLQMLKTVLNTGMSPDDALDAVQTGWDEEKILEIWRRMSFSGTIGTVPENEQVQLPAS